MNNKYISDITEEEKNSREYGDAQVLIAGDEDKNTKVVDKKIGNQSKEYYQQ